jgi:hypothetical protein
MFNRTAELLAAAFDLTGPLSGWAALSVAALVVVIYAVIAVRSEPYGRVPTARIALALVLALTAVWVLDGFKRRAFVAEGQMLERRAFELASRALMPRSALACLDAVAGGAVEESCEKALFASPEATASAVSYVATELSLLAAASAHARRSNMGYGYAVSNLRRSLEADRFGIVAHVLATRDGCTPEQCAAFAFLQGTGRVSANLVDRPFDAYLTSHQTVWAAGRGALVANNAPAANQTSTAPAAAAKQPNNLYFPSSSSIPAVNIMSTEPQPPKNASGATAPARKSAPPAVEARQQSAPNPTPAPAPPMRLTPGGQ